MRLGNFGAALFLVAAGCESSTEVEEKPDGESEPVEEEPEEIPVEDDTGTIDEDLEGRISGRVQAELYTTDVNGEIVALDWAEVYGNEFPFGGIFVAAYTIDEPTGLMRFHDQYVIRSPDPEGNTYELEVDPAVAPSVRVYAVLDYGGDGVLSPSEPTGIYPDEVALSAGSEASDVDIDIPTPWYDFGLGGGGGGGGWDAANYVKISGDGLITKEYEGGSCLAMLYDTAGAGPYYASSFTPEQTDAGGVGTYELYVGKGFGAAQLVGAWDANFNGFIDPADEWGQYVDETGAVANPITIGTDDLPDMTLLIPDGTGLSLSSVPFVVITGDIGYSEGSLADLPAGASVVVAAMKYRPDSDLSISDVENNAYDVQTFTGADLAGNTVPYTLIAPANTLAYLWVYADLDGDSEVNEAGEPIGAYEGTGRFATGTGTRSGVDLTLLYVEE